MTDWTPGPWNHDPKFPTSIWANDVWLASTNVESIQPFKTRMANARLIAASPELYEALKALVDLDDGDEPGLWKFEEDFAAARAALEKAEGK